MTGTAHTKAAEVLAEHRREQVARIDESDQSLWLRCQGCRVLLPLERPWEEHQADMLAAAGLLADPHPSPVEASFLDHTDGPLP